jgi:hypothetical protein
MADWLEAYHDFTVVDGYDIMKKLMEPTIREFDRRYAECFLSKVDIPCEVTYGVVWGVGRGVKNVRLGSWQDEDEDNG